MERFHSILSRIFLLGVYAAISGFAPRAHAVPGEAKLFSPIRLERVGDELKITVKLPCKNEGVTDWARAVLTSDDSGDMQAGVAVMIPMSHCQPGPEKEFSIQMNPASEGYQFRSEDINDDFVPLTLCETNVSKRLK
jgi:hypothetical protein